MAENTKIAGWQEALKKRFGSDGRGRNWSLSPQIYADHAVRHGWRVSENVLTGRAHLRNPAGKLVMRGEIADCLAALEGRVAALGPPPPRMVIYLHGLGLMRFNDRWSGLVDALADHDIACTVVRYPSTLGRVPDHARRLAQLITRIGDVRDIALVGHSMGGLLIRKLLDEPLWHHGSRELKCITMLGTPNQGAAISERLARFKPYDRLLGGGGEAVRPEYAQALPVPNVPCLIIAGGTGKKTGFNPLLGADNDGLVRVDETRLAGAEGPIVVHNDHFTLTENPEAIAASVKFITRYLTA